MSTNNNNQQAIEEQKVLCSKYGSDFIESKENFKLGISLNVKDNIVPSNGIRYEPDGNTTDWYIWAGEELLQDPDFFVPLHISHIDKWNPKLKKYLGLAPGWRFLIAGDYEDVWYDSQLLELE